MVMLLLWNLLTRSNHHEDQTNATQSLVAKRAREKIKMKNLTIEQQEVIDANSDKIILLSEKIWESINEIDYDPMNPSFKYLDDPIKDKIIEHASMIICYLHTPLKGEL